MDDSKDLQTNAFAKFLDSRLHVNPFGKNRSGDRAYRRAERLSAAIFLMSKHIPGEEPLRNEVRIAALATLPKILACKDEMRSTMSESIADVQATLRHLISLIRLMVFSGFVSAQNAEIVTIAADELGNFVSVA